MVMIQKNKVAKAVADNILRGKSEQAESQLKSKQTDKGQNEKKVKGQNSQKSY